MGVYTRKTLKYMGVKYKKPDIPDSTRLKVSQSLVKFEDAQREARIALTTAIHVLNQSDVITDDMKAMIRELSKVYPFLENASLWQHIENIKRLVNP